MCCVETSKPPSKALVMPAKGFNSQVPRVQTSSITNAKPKPAKCFNSQVPRSLQNCFQFSSATQRPGNCFNSQVPGNLQNASTHNLPANCFNAQVPRIFKLLQITSARKICKLLPHTGAQTKACTLLQFPLARKTCEMLSTHNCLQTA